MLTALTPKEKTKTILKGQADQATSADDSIANPNATVALNGEHKCDAARPEIRQTIDACEDAIRSLAHSKWEAAGCPPGDGFDIWLEAEREINAERSESSSAQG